MALVPPQAAGRWGLATLMLNLAVGTLLPPQQGAHPS